MFHIDYGGRRDRMEVGFTTTYAISSYQRKELFYDQNIVATKNS
jgi:hypothetical protein